MTLSWPNSPTPPTTAAVPPSSAPPPWPPPPARKPSSTAPGPAPSPALPAATTASATTPSSSPPTKPEPRRSSTPRKRIPNPIGVEPCGSSCDIFGNSPTELPERASTSGSQHLFVHDQECAEAVEVVGGAGSADVEGVRADVRADADLAEVGAVVGAQRDLLEDALVAAGGDDLEGRVDVAAFDGAGDDEGVHAGAGGLGPVVGAGALVHDLEPAAGGRVLDAGEAGDEVAQDGQQPGAVRVVRG